MNFCSTKKSHTVLCGIFFGLVLIGADQLLKQIVLHIGIIRYMCNYGIAMGIILPRIVFILFWIGLISVVIYFWLRHITKNFYIQLPYILMLAGGFGNIIDRLYYGCVIDYIPFLHISLFNFADVFITVGAMIIIVQNWMIKE